ncbi:hypothetical protein [uncultured Pseudacidovorax sp.]|uniref:hypothetical protein n=1 Tax=uncultured Pseudacidovorax sp. TaxID=679313 RepID=UPI0025FE3D34|nr:hypothetical protein [uncultured Pseudacidovorax sp.]
MIVYADTGKASIEHLEFNFSMIEALALLGEVTVALGPAQSEYAINTKKYLKVLPLKILADPRNKLAFFKKLVFEIFAIIKVIRFARKNSAVVVFGYVFPMAQWFVHFAARLSKVRTVLILHGELGSLAKQGWRSWFGSKPWVLLNIWLSNLRWIECFVLDERISNNLSKIGVSINWITHPYRFAEDERVGPLKFLGAPIVLTFAGTLSTERGYANLLRLSELLKDLIEEGRVAIKHVGATRGLSEAAVEALRANGVQLSSPYKGKFLSEEEYNSKIKNSDLLLILINQDIYRFIFSAAILDCLKFQVPFLTLSGAIFSPLVTAEKKPGLICETIPEMAQTIRKIAGGAPPEVNAWDLRALREKHGVVLVSDEMRNKFKALADLKQNTR